MSSATHHAFRMARWAVVLCTALGAAGSWLYAWLAWSKAQLADAWATMIVVGALGGLTVGMVIGAVWVAVAVTFVENRPPSAEQRDESND